MPNPAQKQQGRLRGRPRLLALSCAAAALLVPSVITAVEYWGDSSTTAQMLDGEQSGVTYLGPLTNLITVLADSQSAAVAGRAVDTDRLKQAVSAVVRVDQPQGNKLRTTDTWSSLQSDIAKLEDSKATGRDAYAAYSPVIDRVLFLVTRVGDNSQIVLDPKIDTYYLGDAAVIWLPNLIVDTGRTADLNTLRSPGDNGAGLSTVMVARDRVGTEASIAQQSLTKSLDATSGTGYGVDLLTRIDGFRAAVGAIAPATELIDQPLPPDAASMDSARARLSSASIQLESTALQQLQSLLKERADAVSSTRSDLIVAWLVGVAVAGACWLLVRPGGIRLSVKPKSNGPGTHGGGRRRENPSAAAAEPEAPVEPRPARASWGETVDARR